MAKKALRPRLSADGSLDPLWLEEAGEAWAGRWLRDRLEGWDPYFPINVRVDEDPDALLVALLRHWGVASPGSRVLGRCLLVLLDRARTTAASGEDVPYFPSLLRVFHQIRVPGVSTWFTEELASIARDPAARQAFWRDPRAVKDILFAAMIQAPGEVGNASRQEWLALLRHPTYSTMALLGLGQSLPQQLPYLKEWWRHCPPKERKRELRQMIPAGLQQENRQGLKARLLDASRGWPLELKSAIDKEWKRVTGENSGLLDVPGLEPDSVHCRAISGAAKERRERRAA